MTDFGGGAMSLKGFFKPDVITVSPDQLVTEAAAVMRDYNVGDVVVVKEQGASKIPVGLLTDRDITVGCVAAASDRINDLSVEEVMTPKPVCAQESWGIYELVQAMRSNGVSRMPVVDQTGCLIGIISAKNILALLNDELSEIVEIADKQKHAGEHTKVKGGQPSSRAPSATPPIQ
jgi:CBS domain-containing protein